MKSKSQQRREDTLLGAIDEVRQMKKAVERRRFWLKFWANVNFIIRILLWLFVIISTLAGQIQYAIFGIVMVLLWETTDIKEQIRDAEKDINIDIHCCTLEKALAESETPKPKFAPTKLRTKK